MNTVISVLLLEGIGRQLDPNLDLFKSALPILRQLGRQMSTQENIRQMERRNIGAFFKVSLKRLSAIRSGLTGFVCRYGSIWKQENSLLLH